MGEEVPLSSLKKQKGRKGWRKMALELRELLKRAPNNVMKKSIYGVPNRGKVGKDGRALQISEGDKGNHQ